MSLTAPAGLISDVVISIPIEDVKQSSGLALDIGSTVGKIVYRSNKEYKNGQPISLQGETNEGQIHFAMFPREDVEGMIKYIKDNCDLMRDETGQVMVNSSGCGAAAFRLALEDGLSCKMTVLPEFDCFGKAFIALEKILSEDDMFIPVSPEVKAEIAAAEAKRLSLMEKMKDKLDMKLDEDKGMTDEEVKLMDQPRLLVMAGSGTGFMQINKDDTYSLVGGTFLGGRTMYGLASILSGENDFAALTDMASKADGKTSDTWITELLGTEETAGPKDNIYEMGNRDENRSIFPFGKGITTAAGEMKKEDLVWSVFHSTALLHGDMINLHVKLSKAKVVYFVGNTFNTEVTRNMLVRALTLGNLALSERNKFNYYFVKNGGMFGALGAYLHK